MTNLEQPAVLELFEELCKKGVLKPSLPLPKNLHTLESYIENINIKPYYGGSRLMNPDTKKAILVVSFGTSHEDTRKVTIDAIEHDISEAYPDCAIYRAWTSKMILAKLKKRDNVHINNVKEAMEQMVKDGIVDTVVHDEIFCRMAIRDGVSLTDEEMSTVEEKAELYYQELTDPQKATLQISEEDIRAAMEKIGTAEKYAELFCIEKQCEYEDAAVAGNAYVEEMNRHDYKLHHDVWNQVKVGTLTIPDNRL